MSDLAQAHLTAPSKRALYLITGNAHKVEEFKRLLPSVSLVSLREHPLPSEPVESEPTFVGNALIKSSAGLENAQRLGLHALCLADDSGLSVDALSGEPGVLSARYVEGSDADRAHAVLARLQAAGAHSREDRAARFTCVLTLSGLTEEDRTQLITAQLITSQESDSPSHDPSLDERLSLRGERAPYDLCAVGRFEGYIAQRPEGEGGFGYDPIFCARGHEQSVATLSAAQKDALSHRGRALELLKPALSLLLS